MYTYRKKVYVCALYLNGLQIVEHGSMMMIKLGCDSHPHDGLLLGRARQGLPICSNGCPYIFFAHAATLDASLRISFYTSL